MIQSITLKNIASYEPVNGVQISDLKKVNFFFGYNGSGKSTIAKYLNDLSLDSTLKSTDFNQCSQSGYNDNNHQILTFDEIFTDINFNKNPVLKGVFSLNQANAIIDKQIADEESLIKEYENFSLSKNALKDNIIADKNAKQTALLDHCWSQRSSFVTFTKINLAHSGSKPNNLQEIKTKLSNPLLAVLTNELLNESYQTLYEKEIKQINQNINSKIYKEIRYIEVKLQALMQEVIVGNEDVDIASLIVRINARNWVENGMQYLDKTNGICPFCQKNTIDEGLQEQFNKYFDLTYKEKIKQLVELQEQYRIKSQEFLLSISTLQNDFNPDNIVSNIYIKCLEHFEVNSETIKYKIENSNERKNLISIQSLKSELSGIIKEIDANNNNFSDLNKNRQNLVGEIWKHIASKCKTEVKNIGDRNVKYQKISDLAESLIADYSSKILQSKQEIENLRSQTVNTKQAVDNINIILKSTGFNGFEIAEKDVVNNISQYYLKRHEATTGNPVFKSLSEGEKNFVSFLYFYQLCMGTDNLQTNGSKKKIIVIDDPVSSLDSQALFVVSTLIHNLISRKGHTPRSEQKLFKNDNILQVFILTHNLYFYKEVSFAKRPMCTDYWHYKVHKIENKSHVIGEYNNTIHDDYSLLWNTIKELKVNIPTSTSLNIVIANSMRRIIESYVNFIGIGKDSWSSIFDNNQNEPTYYIKCAFISMINDESHKVTALDSVYYQKIINEQPQILFDVFLQIFKTIGKEHYELMMGEVI